jgi:hypothetical protein
MVEVTRGRRMLASRELLADDRIWITTKLLSQTKVQQCRCHEQRYEAPSN